MKLGKMFFISLQKLFPFSRKSTFSILVIQISWRHKMPEYKTRNTFYWVTSEVKTVYQWNLASLCHIVKKTFYQKIQQKLRPENKFQAFLCLQRIKHNLYWKMKFLKQATYIRHVLAKQSKFVQISTLTSSDSFYRGFLEN